MLRITSFIALTIILAVPAQAQDSGSAEAAKQNFDQLRDQWSSVAQQLHAKVEAKAAPGADLAAIQKDIVELQKQSDKLLGQIVAAGLEVFQADPAKYPKVNETLAAIAGFFVTGDANGDGGDQFEKALPIIQALLEGGADKQWPELWIWGGVSAYCTNQYELADKYFKQAKLVGAFEGTPARASDDPILRVRQYGLQSMDSIPEMQRAWEREEMIRATEKAADDLPRVKLTTTRGDILIELFENEAPQTVANFLTLVKQGYYSNVPFHRVLPGFMAQGGDPTGTGSGGPGYTIRDEQGLPKSRHHFRGSLSMANTGQPNSGGSQFFLTFVPTSYLDGRHAVFGRVVEGMDVAAALKRREPSRGGPSDKILSATVLRDRGHDYRFEKIPD